MKAFLPPEKRGASSHVSRYSKKINITLITVTAIITVALIIYRENN